MSSSGKNLIFLTVLRASSAVRVPPNTAIVWNSSAADGTYEITIRTRHHPFEGGDPIPRELWVQVIGPGLDLDDGMRRAQGHANVASSVLGTAMNAAIDELQLELAFDISPHLDEHDFFQNFLLDETGLPRMARIANQEVINAVLTALCSAPHSDDLFRAVAQYELALRNFQPGHETLAVAHLYMAVEALTQPAIARALNEHSAEDIEALARHWSITPRTCGTCGHQYGLKGLVESAARRRVVCQGHDELFTTARKASDSLEHGYGEFAKILKTSKTIRDDLATVVRTSIFDLAQVESTISERLFAPRLTSPLPCVRTQKYLRARIVGDPLLARADDCEYPLFELSSSFTSPTQYDDGVFTCAPREEMRLRASATAVFREPYFEMIAPAPDSRNSAERLEHWPASLVGEPASDMPPRNPPTPSSTGT